MQAKWCAGAISGLLAGALMAGCDREDTARKAAEDARDIAMVERMSREPLKPIIPAPITAIDVARYGLDRAGCAFRKHGQRDPLFLGGADDGFMRIDGDLRRYAAKQQSAQLPGGARTTYVGLSSWIDLARLPDAATGGDARHWPARLIIHDSLERIAFMADGTVTCRD